MELLPLYIPGVFILTTLLSIYLFSRSCPGSKLAWLILMGWTIIQGLIAWTGFYKFTDSLPPRFILVIIPPLICLLALFFTSRGRSFIDGLDTRALTLLHVVRIPVELVLLWLFIHKMVPQLMTFEGRNFDILSGITAPLIYYFGFIKKQISNKAILWWNIICLGLLFNIVVLAILSAPFPFQQMAFDQPNVAVFYFPYVWLPGVVVPLVLFSHLVVIRRFLVQGSSRAAS